MQAMNRPARRSGPTNTEHRWDMSNVAMFTMSNGAMLHHATL